MFEKQSQIQKVWKKPPKTPEYKTWHTLCIDLISIYQVGQGKNKITLYYLIIIDPATRWFEIVEIPIKRADDVVNLLEFNWLSQYSWLI